MKKIEAIIRPEKLGAVRQALEEVDFPGLMITEIEGHGKQKGLTQQWRGRKYKVELLSKVKIEIVVRDEEVDRIVKALMESAKTGDIGDGKIFVSAMENAIRIRTGEKGEAAL
jgi:nitrogen regulatory protein P-II 1